MCSASAELMSEPWTHVPLKPPPSAHHRLRGERTHTGTAPDECLRNEERAQGERADAWISRSFLFVSGRVCVD